MPRRDSESLKMERRLAGFITGREVLRPGERALLLLSGGADSMALLHLLTVVGRDLGLELQPSALHVDYGTRGEESDRDRGIVERACAALGVPLHVVRLKGALAGTAFQERARELRYREARGLAATHGYNVLVTAHNRDDQVETVLYRLAKYASPRGLVGMRARQGDLARPLLCLGAAEIRSYCAARGIAYGEDLTNLRACYARNVIRLEVIPPLRRINPRVVETLAATADLADTEASVLAAAAAAALERALRPGEEGPGALDVAALSTEPPALRALVLHQWVRAALEGDALVERRMVQALQSLLDRPQEGGRVSLRGGLEAVRSGGRLRLRRRLAHACGDLAVEGERLAAAPEHGAPVSFCGRRLRVRLQPGSVVRKDTPGDWLGLGAPPGHLTLRHPRRGERFAPLGLGAETTVARFLAAARVPADARSRALVLDVDGMAGWVGFAGPGGRLRGRVAHPFRVDESSRWTLHIREEDA